MVGAQQELLLGCGGQLVEKAGAAADDQRYRDREQDRRLADPLQDDELDEPVVLLGAPPQGGPPTEVPGTRAQASSRSRNRITRQGAFLST